MNTNIAIHNDAAKCIFKVDCSREQLMAYFESVCKLVDETHDEFPVNLDDVWPLVYSAKEKAVRALTTGEQFIEDIDYRVLSRSGENPLGGRPTNDYYLSISCLEYLIARKRREVFEVYRQFFNVKDKMFDIQIFKNEHFGEIRTVVNESGEPLFCASDICNALGYANGRDAVTKHVSEDDVVKRDIIDSLGRTQSASFVNESGLYSLIFGSKLESAKAFKKWVTSEVLPSIRKHGGYIVAKEDETAEELMARCLIVANETLKRRDERIRLLEAVNTEQAKAISEMSPKATYYNIILQSPSTVTVTQIAQDYGKSAKAFNKLLHDLGIQRKVGRQWVLYSQYIASGYVQSATEPMKNSHTGRSYTYSRWTQKGRIFLYNELKNRGVLPMIEQNL